MADDLLPKEAHSGSETRHGSELDSKYFVESRVKPTWTPSVPAPVLDSVCKSDKSVPLSSPETKKAYSLETEAWDFLDDGPSINKPRLISAPSSKASVVSTPKDEADDQTRVISSLYDKLTKTEKPTASVATPQLAPRLHGTLKRVKTYSLVRSFRVADAEPVDLQDQDTSLGPRKPLTHIQDINQLRMNGLSLQQAADLDYLVEDFQSTDIKYLRSASLEFTLKVLDQPGFCDGLRDTGIPEQILKLLLDRSSEDQLLLFCFLVVCCKLDNTNSEALISQLKTHEKDVNACITLFSPASMSQLKLTKVNQSVFQKIQESLVRNFSSNDFNFYRYLFMKKVCHSIVLNVDLVDLSPQLDDELIMNLTIFESILMQNDQAPLSRDMVLRLMDICMFSPAEKNILKSCQILALKCLIIYLSDSMPEVAQFTHSLFGSLVRDFEPRVQDPLGKNILLLQLGLLLDLLGAWKDPSTVLLEKVCTRYARSLDEFSVHCVGYTSLVYATTHQRGKLQLQTNELHQVLGGLASLYEKITEKTMQDRINHLRNYIESQIAYK